MTKVERWVEQNMTAREHTFTLNAQSRGVHVELFDHGLLRCAKLMHPSWSNSHTLIFVRREFDEAYSYLRSYIFYRAGNGNLFPMNIFVPNRPHIGPASPECCEAWTVNAWNERPMRASHHGDLQDRHTS